MDLELSEAAMRAGIPERNFRWIETDDQYRVLPEALERAVREDAARGLKMFGIRAFADNLAEKLRLTQDLYQRFLGQESCECLNVPELSVIAFRYRPARGDIDDFNRRLLAEINRSGKLFLSSTLLRKRFVIRVCILSFRTHQAEIDEAFQVIVDTARTLEQSL